jgi:protein TonB
VPKPAQKPARKPRPGKKAARKPIPKPKPAPPRKVEKPASKPNKLSKLFPTYDELTKFDRQEEQHRRTAPPGPNRPHIPGKLKRSTTISLNTMSFEYHSYYLALKRKIELVWEYPYEARRRGIQGRLRIHFVINLDGSLAEVKILRSSGSNLLDYEAVRAIKNAAPFPPLPKRMNTRTLTVNATFEYLLSYRSVH